MTEPEDERRLIMVDGTDALAFLIVQPEGEGIRISAETMIHQADAAKIMRAVADKWDPPEKKGDQDHNRELAARYNSERAYARGVVLHLSDILANLAHGMGITGLGMEIASEKLTDYASQEFGEIQPWDNLQHWTIALHHLRAAESVAPGIAAEAIAAICARISAI